MQPWDSRVWPGDGAELGGASELLPKLLIGIDADVADAPPAAREGLLGPAAPSGPSSPFHWLVRLGDYSGQRRRGGGGGEHHIQRQRLSRSEWARHAILTWRLQRPYLIYCCGCAAIMAFLLGWNVVKGMQNSWNLPQWRHHPWEEALEVGVGVVTVSEIALTLRVLGPRAFFASCWCICDLVVALLTAVSMVYGLQHLGRMGEVCEADVPLLLLRFILQPARVLAALAATCRARRMQARVDELAVDFDALPLGGECGGFGGHCFAGAGSQARGGYASEDTAGSFEMMVDPT